MNQNLQLKHILLFALLLTTTTSSLFAKTVYSVDNGDWYNPNTWQNQTIPTEDDDVVINPGHTVVLSAAAYVHFGNITIENDGELIADVGDHVEGFVFSGLEFHVLGGFFTHLDQDFAVTNDGLFWIHPGAEVRIREDLKMMDEAQVVIEATCVRVDDDFEIYGTLTTICGNGGVSIGDNDRTNNFVLMNGASTSQICLGVQVFRSNGEQTCTSTVDSGTGNTNPVAVDDQLTVAKNTITQIDVLNEGTPDSDNNIGDKLQLIAVGTDFSNNQMTKEGGQVTILDNGTPLDPTDDLVEYTPANNFTGIDGFRYVITDANGGYAAAEVVLNVLDFLPVELVSFNALSKSCKVTLNWATASELDNSHFEIERSADGYQFERIGQVRGHGTTNVSHAYDYVDAQPFDQNYYRLVQVDYNGDRTTSEVIYRASNCEQHEVVSFGPVTLSPTPTPTGTVALSLRAQQSETTTLTIIDLYGKVVYREQLAIEAGNNTIDLQHIESLPVGNYAVQVGEQVTRMVVAR